MSLYGDATVMTPAQWRELFARPDARLRALFDRLFGEDDELAAHRLGFYRRFLDRAAAAMDPDRPASLLRVPGRINTMGIHSDGQLSFKNHVVFGREVLGLVQARRDDRVGVANLRQHYPAARFGIGELLPPGERRDPWLDIIERATVTAGAWHNYVLGPVLALQHRFPDTHLRGFDVFIDGDIPVAVGVSSSSALATLAGIATIWVNQLEIAVGEAIRVIGAGEWYSGSRGGPGDTGAQVLCRHGHVLHIRYDIAFDPYEEHHLGFPSDWRIVLMNSLVRARKTLEAREATAARGLAGFCGAVILRDRFPELEGTVRCLYDLRPENTGLELAEIYQMLKALPERTTMEEIPRLAPGRRDELEPHLRLWRASLPDFPMRSVCLYFLCEPTRGAMKRAALEAQDEAVLGALFRAAHDGDRVVRWPDDRTSVPHDNSASDALLDDLSRRAASADPAERASAALGLQPGGFGNSVAEVDLLVDIASGVDGVIGARITGAGGGGCAFAYAHEAAAAELVEQVRRRYYEPRGLPTECLVLSPTQGGGPLVLD